VASYQRAIVDTLVAQTKKAADRLQPPSIILVGGVACNSLLRRRFTEAFGPERVYYPSPVFTTDNAAMIAAAGIPKLLSAPAFQMDLNAFADFPLC
jgi:N6-L-threonylcarbamoyladenine synthase